MPETQRLTSLFDRPTTPLARDRDSMGSFIAAEKLAKSGRLRGQMRIVFSGVQRWPGKTSAELAALLDCSRYDTARRLPNLAARDLVRRGRERKCQICKIPCLTWWPTGEPDLFREGVN